MDDAAFHDGERTVQERTGERAMALLNVKNISSGVPANARSFVEEQRWCVNGAEDDNGAVFAQLLTGETGFVRTSDDLQLLRLNIADPDRTLKIAAPYDDLRVGRSVGFLFIDLQTRKRLRVNGHVASKSANSLAVEVSQAFPLCPRYIQKRELAPSTPGVKESILLQNSGVELSAEVIDWISRADTTFIASLGPTGEADVSHRGGKPGFVQVDGQALRIPDFNGNSMFNTLGNLEVESRLGMVLPDFDGSRQLQLTGHATTRFDATGDMDATGGTGRWIEFTISAWRITSLNRPLRWRFLEASRFNP